MGELAETRHQQEMLGVEIQEAELHQRQHQHFTPLQLLGLPALAPQEAKRRWLHEVVLALKEIAKDPPDPAASEKASLPGAAPAAAAAASAEGVVRSPVQISQAS